MINIQINHISAQCVMLKAYCSPSKEKCSHVVMGNFIGPDRPSFDEVSRFSFSMLNMESRLGEPLACISANVEEHITIAFVGARYHSPIYKRIYLSDPVNYLLATCVSVLSNVMSCILV